MFETGIRQVRMAMAMVNGRRINPQVVQRLVADADATLREFGAPGDDVDQLLDGPFADPSIREHLQTQGIRRTARRLAKVSPFYRARFGAVGVDPRKLTLAALPLIPATTKADLVANGAQFVCEDSAAYLSTRTTGTTGRPVEVWLSRYECELWPAVAALAGLLRNEINHDDCLQINLSSRATAAVQHDIEVCRLVGARSRALGLIPVEHSLDMLVDGDGEPATLLGTYPSYLARLVTEARRRGLRPNDFRLRRVDVAGELLTSALIRGTSETFGARPSDTFAMTEVLPVSGRTCADGHLHIDLNMGLVEVITLDGTRAATAGELGTLVVTPFYPYRECMPVFRYDTRDVVRVLPDERLQCNLAGVPATSAILGKADQLVDLGATTATPRDIADIVESLPAHAWPAQYRATADGETLRLTVPADALEHSSTADVERAFRRIGIRADVAVVPAGTGLRAVRADLAETTFTLNHVLQGV